MNEDNDNEDFRQGLLDAIKTAEAALKDSVLGQVSWVSGGDLFLIVDELSELHWEMASLIPALDNYRYETAEADLDRRLVARAERDIDALDREFEAWLRLDREERGIPHPEAA